MRLSKKGISLPFSKTIWLFIVIIVIFILLVIFVSPAKGFFPFLKKQADKYADTYIAENKPSTSVKQETAANGVEAIYNSLLSALSSNYEDKNCLIKYPIPDPSSFNADQTTSAYNIILNQAGKDINIKIVDANGKTIKYSLIKDRNLCVVAGNGNSPYTSINFATRFFPASKIYTDKSLISQGNTPYILKGVDSITLFPRAISTNWFLMMSFGVTIPSPQGMGIGYFYYIDKDFPLLFLEEGNNVCFIPFSDSPDQSDKYKCSNKYSLMKECFSDLAAGQHPTSELKYCEGTGGVLKKNMLYDSLISTLSKDYSGSDCLLEYDNPSDKDIGKFKIVLTQSGQDIEISVYEYASLLGKKTISGKNLCAVAGDGEKPYSPAVFGNKFGFENLQGYCKSGYDIQDSESYVWNKDIKSITFENDYFYITYGNNKNSQKYYRNDQNFIFLFDNKNICFFPVLSRGEWRCCGDKQEFTQDCFTKLRAGGFDDQGKSKTYPKLTLCEPPFLKAARDQVISHQDHAKSIYGYPEMYLYPKKYSNPKYGPSSALVAALITVSVCPDTTDVSSISSISTCWTNDKVSNRACANGRIGVSQTCYDEALKINQKNSNPLPVLEKAICPNNAQTCILSDIKTPTITKDSRLGITKSIEVSALQSSYLIQKYQSKSYGLLPPKKMGTIDSYKFAIAAYFIGEERLDKLLDYYLSKSNGDISTSGTFEKFTSFYHEGGGSESYKNIEGYNLKANDGQKLSFDDFFYMETYVEKVFTATISLSRKEMDYINTPK